MRAEVGGRRAGALSRGGAARTHTWDVGAKPLFSAVLSAKTCLSGGSTYRSQAFVAALVGLRDSERLQPGVVFRMTGGALPTLLETGETLDQSVEYHFAGAL
jgi:hypothetical protein